MTLDDRDPRACLRRPEHPILLPLLLLLCLTATNRTHGRDCLSPRRVAPATATRPRPEPPLPPSRSRRTRIRTRTGTGNDPSPSSRRRKSKSSSSWPSAFRSSSSATVLRACDNNNNNNGSNDRRLTLRYHQRHLPKKIRQCRNDADKALAILGEAYPHYLACISTSRNPTRKEMEPHRHSLDFLQSILGDDDDKRNKKNTDEQDEGQPLVTIIDGKSISAVMEVLRKANDISTAWHLLRSSVDAVRTNRRVRKRTFQRLKPHPREHPDDEDDDDDRNELRQIYKSAISLLGNLPPPTTSEIPELLLWILDRHMPENGIVPEAEIYHAAVNALGKCGAHRHVAVLLERMERSRELSSSSLSSSVPRHGNSSTTQQRPTAPPVDKMAYQTAIASLSKSGHCRTATRFLRRMRSGGFPPDIGCYEALLIGIAKEAGRYANGEGKPETSKDDDAPWHRVALRILREMEWDYESGNTAVKPTRQTYDSVISACGKEGAWDEAARVARREAMWRFGSDDVVISKNGRFSTNALGKEGKTTVPFGCHDNVEHGSTIWNGEPRDAMSSYFQCLGCYRKVGKGKESWWEMGRYGIIEFDANANSDGKVSNRHMADCRLAYGDYVPPQNEVARTIKIGLQPHKNPVRNGISLVFYDEDTGVKLGRILLKNSSSKLEHGTNAPNAATTFPPSSRSHYFSSLIGMEVNKSRRGEGLSKIFLAIWLRICLETDAFPRAAVMNKPLIALVLQRFGFVPRDGGVSVELIRFGTNDDDVVVDLDRGTTRHDQPKDDVGLSPSTESVAKFGLYSPHAKSLQGIFSQRVLRTQNIAILDHLPSTRSRGTTIHLKTTFEHPMAIEENVVDYNPPRVVDINEYGGVSRGQRGSLRDGPLERQKLELKINEVLKIGKNDGIESTESYGLVEFFSSSSSLRHAFLSYASWFG